MKGKIALTGKMRLESNEQQWQLLLNGLIDKIETSALIEQEDKTIRIRIVITDIKPPEHRQVHTDCRVQTNIGADVSKGIARISTYLNQMIEQNAWLFIAHILGTEQVPIIIIYYPLLNIFLYSQKKKNEEKENFLPIFMQN